MGLFKRKEGGTRIGNLVRRVAQAVVDKATMGIANEWTDPDGDGKINLW